jgi:serine/threonine-protein kinase
LARGTRLGPYEVLDLVGVGGMGEIYRARDTRLDRVVALKTLAPHLAARADMRQRFEREARAISRLSHPNICAVFDVGEAVGVDGPLDYLVMEYLEGETLVERLRRGPLPPAELFDCAVQVAEALAWAHAFGLVHRDLKPGNVMLVRGGPGRPSSGGGRVGSRTSGNVKLLDFGLAKLTAPPVELGRASSQAATRPGGFGGGPLTAEGTVLGTIEYMAPEQLERGESDARSDIYAFGLLLHELATGERAFRAATPASLIAAVLTTEPPAIHPSRADLPPALDRVVRRCLAKVPEERWQSAWDLARVLELVAAGDDAPAPAKVPAPWQRLAAGVALGAVLVGGLWLARETLRPTRGAVSAVLSVTLPADDTLEVFTGPSLALSPDGRRLVYVARRAGVRQLFLRDLDRAAIEVVAGSEGGQAPFFSPDGREIAFFANGKLVKAPLGGGPLTVLAEAPSNRGGSWGSDGAIVFAPSPSGGLWRVRADHAGGEPGPATPLTTLEPARGENGHRWPELLPGSRALLFTIRTDRIESFDAAKVVVRNLITGEQRVLVDGGSDARFLPPDRLLFARAGNVYALAFDPSRLAVSGTPERLVAGVSMNPTSGAAMYAVAGAGTVAYFPGTAEVFRHHLVWVGRGGVVRTVADLGRRVSSGALSPDRERLVVRVPAGNDDLWIFELARQSFLRLTSEPGDELGPVWSRDGHSIAYGVERAGVRTMFLQSADRSSTPRRQLLANEHDQQPEDYSPDGRLLVYTETAPQTGDDLWLLPLAADGAPAGAPRQLLASPFTERGGRFSPDGRLLAYTSNESGRDEVYLQPFPALDGKVRVSLAGGYAPRFSPAGDALFYRADDAVVRVALSPVVGSTVPAPGPPEVWIRGPYSEPFAVSPDGREVLLSSNADDETRRTVIDVLLGRPWLLRP